MGLSTARRHEVPEGFPALLEGFRERLDRELDALLERKRRQASDAGSPEMLELIEGVGQLAVHGGKRLRPALVYHAYLACGGPAGEEVMPLALATELLHTYLLIHDDIMDHAEVRRGQPAAHVRFRNAHRARGFHGDAPTSAAPWRSCWAIWLTPGRSSWPPARPPDAPRWRAASRR